jgi:hypothetical protein
LVIPPSTLADHSRSLLLAAAALDAFAALLHLACIFVGAPMYRAMGAGPAMAAMAQAGHWYPAVVTAAIAAALVGCSAFALAGAGALPQPPLLKLVLALIAAVFIARGFMAVPAFLAGRNGAGSLYVMGAGGPIAFWYWSSAISFGLGALHLLGLAGAWSRL